MMVLAYPDTDQIAASKLAGASTASDNIRIPSTQIERQHQHDPDFLLIWHSDQQKTLYVDIERDVDGTFIVTSERFDVYGVGTTQQEAIDNFQEMLFDYYKELIDEEEILGPHLKSELRKLRNLLN